MISVATGMPGFKLAVTEFEAITIIPSDSRIAGLMLMPLSSVKRLSDPVLGSRA